MNLKQDTLLIRLSTGTLPRSRKLARIEGEIASEHAADRKWIGARAKIIPADVRRDIDKLLRDCRAYYLYETLPWGETGYRIIPADRLEELTAKIADYKARLDAHIAEIEDRYETIRDTAKQALGGLWDDINFPDCDKLVRSLYIRYSTLPVPDVSSDFRLHNIDEASLEKIREQASKEIESYLAETKRAIVDRIIPAVQNLSIRMKGTEKFKEAAIGNISKLCDSLKKLNFTQDSEISRLLEKTKESLTEHKAEEIRQNPALRPRLAEKADEVLKDLESYVPTI